MVEQPGVNLTNSPCIEAPITSHNPSTTRFGPSELLSDFDSPKEQPTVVSAYSREGPCIQLRIRIYTSLLNPNFSSSQLHSISTLYPWSGPFLHTYSDHVDTRSDNGWRAGSTKAREEAGEVQQPTAYVHSCAWEQWVLVYMGVPIASAIRLTECWPTVGAGLNMFE